MGSAFSLLLAVALARARPIVFATTFPLEMPLFAVLGSLGGLIIFSGDRAKGVFEYLLAYGVRPTTIFGNGVLAALGLAATVLAVALAAGLGTYFASGGTPTADLAKSIGLYAVPMSLAGTVFSTTAGMYWASLSSPRSGFNSPLGVAPLLGVGPTVLVLVTAETAPAADFYWITVGAAAILGAAALTLVAASGRLLRSERLLSPL